jgi:hypothetical protein
VPVFCGFLFYTCRAERLKLEKDYLELQGKAFAAPGSALVEVRTSFANILVIISCVD